jgi:L-serine dehydratase
LQAYHELAKPGKKKMLEAILVSGFMGMILFNDVSTAGADYGCQAEVGVGAAMAACALAWLEGGNSEQVIHAFTLAIKNSLGLICDPVAGLVEVPCVKRNGVFASVAVSAAMMSLSGVRSFISPDEVVLTMKEVGDKLHRDYKETAGGGLAKTRDGKAVERAFESEVKRFFGD